MRGNNTRSLCRTFDFEHVRNLEDVNPGNCEFTLGILKSAYFYLYVIIFSYTKLSINEHTLGRFNFHRVTGNANNVNVCYIFYHFISLNLIFIVYRYSKSEKLLIYPVSIERDM